MDVLTLEIEAYRPGSGAGTPLFAMGITPLGDPPPWPMPLESIITILASDTGYRSRESDAGGLRVFPPRLMDGLQIQRGVNLPPGAPAAAAAWGELTLANLDGRYDDVAARFNADRRRCHLRFGRKVLDPVRGIEVDPPLADLATLLVGMGQPWRPGNDVLTLPLRDATYWLERPLLLERYAGTGGLEGPAEMAGKPKPKLRGGYRGLGTPGSEASVRNITPVLVDPDALIWQVSDGPGVVFSLYTGGDPGNYARAADSTDLYSGSLPAGSYRVMSQPYGLYVQLGSPVANGWALTVDAVGDFRSAGAIWHPLHIARLLLTEEMGLDPALVDLPSFTAAASAEVSRIAGDWWGDSVTAVDAISPLLESMGARLVPRRDGRLRCILLRRPSAAAVPVAEYTPHNILGDVQAMALPDSLNPPPYRHRVAYARNYTPMSGSLDPDIASDTARVDDLAQQERLESWTSAAVLASYLTPNDPEPVQTRLLSSTDAKLRAIQFQEMWQEQPHLYLVPLAIEDVLAREIGDIVRVTYPQGALRAGLTGVVVADAIDAASRAGSVTVMGWSTG